MRINASAQNVLGAGRWQAPEHISLARQRGRCQFARSTSVWLALQGLSWFLSDLKVKKTLRMSQVSPKCLEWGRGPIPHTN
jgi:hypothetical protein